VNELWERCSGSVPETLHELPCKRQRRPRSLSCLGADRTAGPFLTGFCLASLLVAGLDGCATYHPEPLDAAKTARQFDSRSLSNPELCQCLGANMGANLPSCQLETHPR
jgi:hypothetical protein